MTIDLPAWGHAGGIRFQFNLKRVASADYRAETNLLVLTYRSGRIRRLEGVAPDQALQVVGRLKRMTLGLR